MLEQIAEAIIEHSIIPYAKAAGIETNELIEAIMKINYIEPTVTNIEPIKRKRGRPMVLKNKVKTEQSL